MLRTWVLLCFVSVLSFKVSAQMDSRNNSISIPAEISPDPKDDPELNPSLNDNNFDADPEEALPNDVLTPYEAYVKNNPKEPFSLIKKDNLRSSSELFTSNLKRQLKFEENEKPNQGSKVNQYLGEFRTSDKVVNIEYRDHGTADGDLIRILVNDKVVANRVLLLSSLSGINIPLEKGRNVVDFLALNQGSAGPNTAEFKVVNDAGKIISYNQWNLATGVKATIVLVRDDELKMFEGGK